ncbi:MAG TPA: MFS transporter [Solirubrobacterales bacterium]|nr:MFS transporter [Solirubrobacterales bacterium]
MSALARRSFAALSLHNYRLYFGGQLASLAGNWMQIVAELWLILELTGSGLDVGIATALQFTGILLFGVWGGALADRFDKRRLLIVTQVAMAAPALALFALALTGSVELWIVYALIAARGLVLAVDNPTRQAFVIELVGPERVVNAVALNGALVHSARIAGPAVAGVVIALWGVTLCFALNALTFGVMIGALAAMRTAELAPRPARQDSYGIGGALRYVARTPRLRVPLLLMAALGTLGFNFQVILPLLAHFSFGGDVGAYSLLMVAMGAGAIAGSLFAAARGELGPPVVAAGAAGFAAAGLAAAIAPTLELEMAALALLGAAAVVFAAAINSGLQLAAAPEMRGRVMAIYSVVFLGSTPIGGPISGWLSEAASPRAALALGALAGIGVAIAAHRALQPAPGSGERPAGSAPGAAAEGPRDCTATPECHGPLERSSSRREPGAARARAGRERRRSRSRSRARS